MIKFNDYIVRDNIEMAYLNLLLNIISEWNIWEKLEKKEFWLSNVQFMVYIFWNERKLLSQHIGFLYEKRISSRT